MPLTAKGEKIEGNMEKEYGEEKGKQVFYASKNKGTISGVDSAGKLGSFSREQARVFGNSPVRSRSDATAPLKQRGPGGEQKVKGPIDAYLDSMGKGFK